jgi:hypothetical protein
MDRYNPFSVYSDSRTPYEDIFTPQAKEYGNIAAGIKPTTPQAPPTNGGVGNQITAGLAFTDSLFGEGGSLNPEDIILQKENRIDSENPYLDGSTYGRNMEASDLKTAKGKAKGAALNSMATGAALGSVIPGVGTAIGAIAGGAAGLLGLGSATNKAKKAQEEATTARKKTIKQYNNAMYSVGEQDAAEQRASMYKNNTFNTNLMSLV